MTSPSLAGLRVLPFGPGVLYSGAGKGRCGHLRRLASPEDVQGNALDRQASHLLQYLALEAHPRSKLAASAIHAGPGELPLGANCRQRADRTLVVDWGRLLMVNYHGGFCHYHGHFPSCPAFDASLPAAVNAETVRADAFKAGYARALNAVEGAPASFAYRAYAECDFFHGSRTFRARRSGVEYAELRDLLQAEHPRDAVLGIGRASWRADDLVAAIDAGNLAVVVPRSLRDEAAAALRASGRSFGEATRAGLQTQVALVPVQLVKGLEVDAVIVVEPSQIVAEESQGMRALYVALTRATKRVGVLHRVDLPEFLRLL